MDNLELVERLREKANVTYEEARQALEENGWDLLDAMVSLERQGKVKGPKQSTYSTSYEQQEEYDRVEEKVKEQRKDKPRRESAIGTLIKKFLRLCRDNSFCVNRDGELQFKIPGFAFLIVLIFGWKFVIPAMIVGLFFRLRYSFEGKDDLKEANHFMDSASHAAERVKEEFVKTSNS